MQQERRMLRLPQVSFEEQGTARVLFSERRGKDIQQII